MESLPPSLDVMADEVEAGEVVPAEHRELPWSYFGRGRGALLVLSVLGLICFFLPWVEMTLPDVRSVSAFDLARGRAGWLWGGAVAWFIMLPLVWTRRTIAKMRGVRIICSLFAAMTLGEVAMLMSIPPAKPGYPVAFEFGIGLYASGLVSLIALLFAARFGGRKDDIPALPWLESRARRESGAGETLH